MFETMITKNTMILFALFLGFLRYSLFWLGIWQIKQYDVARFKEFLLRERRDLSVLLFLRLLFFLFLSFLPLLFLRALVLALSVLEILRYLFLRKRALGGVLGARAVFRPALTPKVFLQFLFSSTLFGALSFFIYFAVDKDPFYLFVFLHALFSFFPLFLFSFFPAEVIAKIWWRVLEKRARKKILDMPDLVVVGITGSYGKTSTKEFLVEILKKAGFRVVCNPENHNTFPAILSVILKMPGDTQVLVLEIGAYRKGEIKRVVELVQPHISVLTGLTFQHVSLFGSFEKLKEAKKEIFLSQREPGVSVFNANDPNVLEVARTHKRKKLLVGTKHSLKNELCLVAQNIKVEPSCLSFELVQGEKHQKLSVSLVGVQNIEPLLLACAVALELGVDFWELAGLVSGLKPLAHRMNLWRGFRGIWVLEDSYSMNPKGFLAGISHLKALPGKKIVFMRAFLELGDKEKYVYENVADRLFEVADIVITPDKRCFNTLSHIKKKRGKKTRIILCKKDPFYCLKPLCRPNNSVLVAGRFSRDFLLQLRQRDECFN